MAMRASRKKHVAGTLSSIGLMAATIVISAVVIKVWGPPAVWEWTGVVTKNTSGHWVAKKSLWDLLQLLIVPLMIAIVGIWFSRKERMTERTIADERLQDEAVQSYLDQLSDLLLEKGLRDSKWDQESGLYPEVQTLARARTLTLLRRVDGDRKAL